MPLLRYFLYVGGALLSLILIANVVLPQQSLPGTLTSATELPSVRIQSDRKLPERIVFDTRSMVPAAPVAVLPAPKVAAVVAPAPAPARAVAAEMSAKARVREAFAQLPPSEEVSEPKMDRMARVVVPAPQMYKVKQAPKRVAAPRPYAPRPLAMVAQQPHFGSSETW
ncbi:MAG TPA: hypothetical protein VGH70_02560 [Bradyrhizobium sp.]|jgi:hypothetical protein